MNKSLNELCSPSNSKLKNSLDFKGGLSEEEIRAKIYESWEDFILHEQNPHQLKFIRPEIASSWMRSRKNGVDPFSKVIGKVIIPQMFLKIKKEKAEFLETALPFMEELSKLLFDSGYIVVLADENSTILHISGAENYREYSAQINLKEGVNWSEKYAGTTSTGTCAYLKVPLQVMGAEHYCKSLHLGTCSSAPVFDAAGKLIGILSIASFNSELCHPHTLGMVVSVAWAIQNHLKEKESSHKLKDTNEVLSSILSATSEAIMAVDEKKRIIHVNKEAEKILFHSEKELKGKSVDFVFDDSPLLRDALIKGESLTNIELSVKQKNTSKLCQASIRPIKQNEENLGATITLKSLKTVHHLVTSMSGMHAIFTFNDIIGQSKAIKEAIYQAEMASATGMNILLMGESGTGKELFAQAIHNASRPNGPFVAINCAAIPHSLIESELFGYEAGAFSGAQKEGRPGKFELAMDGTLLLDEIGEMPLKLQPVLLRVLEDKRVMRLGGSKYIPIQTRIIAATNRDLELNSSQGTFRSDLYYRLANMTVKIPPLRERLEDIPLLMEYLVEKMCLRYNKDILRIEPKLYNMFMEYSWPGNVREMENVLEYMVATTKRDALTPDDLPHSFQLKKKTVLISESRANEEEDLSLDEIERRAILQALAEAENIKKAAQILGIGRNTLYRKIKAYKIDLSKLKDGTA